MSVLKEIESFEVYFETLEPGEHFTTPKRTVTETDVVAFAGLSGDYNALHTDAEFAASTIHGQRIAHGLLVLAITSGLCTRLPVMKAMERTLIGLSNLQCRWRRPTFIGDTIHVLLEVLEKTPSEKSDRGGLLLRRTAINQRGETLMESEWKLVLRRKPASA